MNKMSNPQQQEDPFTAIASRVNAVILENNEKRHRGSNAPAAASASSSLDLWQPRDWPHRKGCGGDDKICLNLHSIPLDDTSPGRRPHPCEKCNQPVDDIHHCVLCWKCKGSYCTDCLMPYASCLEFLQSMDSILKHGYGKCPSCSEPLRAIAVTENLRRVIEPVSGTLTNVLGFGIGTLIGDEGNSSINEIFNPNGSARKLGQSLVQEAEQALQRARSLRDNNGSPGGNNDKVKTGKKKDTIKEAIDEYTHVINAITYFASLSKGAGLILRPHDLLLVAHYERAILEGNDMLADAMSACYPKASVRCHDGENQVSLSMHAFRSLFYSLPACMLVGSPQQQQQQQSLSTPHAGGGLLCFDLRNNLKERAFESSEAKEQIRLVGGISNQQQFIKEHPDCDGMDNTYSNLQGCWKGALSYTCNMLPTSMMSSSDMMNLAPVLTLEEEEIHVARFVQFVRVFPTATAAAEYTRIIFETQTIGEEAPSVSAQNCRRLAKIVKKKTKHLLAGAAAPSETTEPVEMSQVHVLQGELITSCVATIGNVSTEILVASSGGDRPLCVLLARVLVHLHKQLESCRAAVMLFANSTVMDDAKIFHRADVTLCAYCGKDDAAVGKLKGCSRCHAVKYCDILCQRNHWNTQGSNSHNAACNLAKQQLKGLQNNY